MFGPGPNLETVNGVHGDRGCLCRDRVVQHSGRVRRTRSSIRRLQRVSRYLGCCQSEGSLHPPPARVSSSSATCTGRFIRYLRAWIVTNMDGGTTTEVAKPGSVHEWGIRPGPAGAKGTTAQFEIQLMHPSEPVGRSISTEHATGLLACGTVGSLGYLGSRHWMDGAQIREVPYRLCMLKAATTHLVAA